MRIRERKLGSCGTSWPTPRMTQPVPSRHTSMTCKRARSRSHDVFLYAIQWVRLQRVVSTLIERVLRFRCSRRTKMGKKGCLAACSLSGTTTPDLWVSVRVVGKEAYARDTEDEQLRFLWRLVDISDSPTTTTSPRPGDDSFTNNILSRLHLFCLLVNEPKWYNHIHGVTTCATATRLSLVVWHVWRFLVRYNNQIGGGIGLTPGAGDSRPSHPQAQNPLWPYIIGGETGMVDNFDVSLSSSFIRKMKLELSETSKLSTIPVSPIMSLFNQFSTRSVNYIISKWALSF